MEPSPVWGLFFNRSYNAKDGSKRYEFPSPTRGLFFYLSDLMYSLARRCGFRPLFGAYFFIDIPDDIICEDLVVGFRPLLGAYFFIRPNQP